MRPGEDELIATLFAPIAGAEGLGLRDDAALLGARPGRDLVVTKDMLVAGVHFFAEDPADAIARKALRVNLSDLAAKGAAPRGCLLGLALPGGWTHDWLKAFAAGLAKDTQTFACPLIGGDTVATPGPLTVSITAFGEVPEAGMVPRTGARAGDRLYVSGTIGDAALGLRLRRDAAGDRRWSAALATGEGEALRERYLLPRPRLALAPVLRAHARAAMDVSDGLLGDLAKMLGLAGCTATIAACRIPLSDPGRSALSLDPTLMETIVTGGDDYEILCAVPEDRSSAFEHDARRAGVAVTGIGVVQDGRGAPVIEDADGRPLAFAKASFSHF